MKTLLITLFSAACLSAVAQVNSINLLVGTNGTILAPINFAKANSLATTTPQSVGVVYYKTNGTFAIGDFVTNGISPTIVAGQLVLPGGVGASFGNWIALRALTNTCENFSIDLIVSNNAGGGGDGLALGGVSVNNWFPVSTYGQFDPIFGFYLHTSTGNQLNNGGLVLPGPGTNYEINYTQRGDSYRLSASWGTNVYQVTFYGGYVPNIANASYLDNSKMFAIYDVLDSGANAYIQSLKITDYDPPAPLHLFIGDSKTKAIGSYGKRMEDYVPGPVVVAAGNGDRIIDAIQSVGFATNYLNPGDVTLWIGRNDEGAGSNITQIATEYMALYQPVTNRWPGIRVYHMLSTPETDGINAGPLNTWIQSTFAASNVVNNLAFFTNSTDIAPDGIHLTPLGYYHEALALSVSYGEPLAPQSFGSPGDLIQGSFIGSGAGLSGLLAADGGAVASTNQLVGYVYFDPFTMTDNEGYNPHVSRNGSDWFPLRNSIATNYPANIKIANDSVLQISNNFYLMATYWSTGGVNLVNGSQVQLFYTTNILAMPWAPLTNMNISMPNMLTTNFGSVWAFHLSKSVDGQRVQGFFAASTNFFQANTTTNFGIYYTWAWATNLYGWAPTYNVTTNITANGFGITNAIDPDWLNIGGTNVLFFEQELPGSLHEQVYCAVSTTSATNGYTVLGTNTLDYCEAPAVFPLANGKYEIMVDATVGNPLGISDGYCYAIGDGFTNWGPIQVIQTAIEVRHGMPMVLPWALPMARDLWDARSDTGATPGTQQPLNTTLLNGNVAFGTRLPTIPPDSLTNSYTTGGGQGGNNPTIWMPGYGTIVAGTFPGNPSTCYGNNVRVNGSGSLAVWNTAWPGWTALFNGAGDQIQFGRVSTGNVLTIPAGINANGFFGSGQGITNAAPAPITAGSTANVSTSPTYLTPFMGNTSMNGGYLALGYMPMRSGMLSGFSGRFVNTQAVNVGAGTNIVFHVYTNGVEDTLFQMTGLGGSSPLVSTNSLAVTDTFRGGTNTITFSISSNVANPPNPAWQMEIQLQ